MTNGKENNTGSVIVVSALCLGAAVFYFFKDDILPQKPQVVQSLGLSSAGLTREPVTASAVAPVGPVIVASVGSSAPGIAQPVAVAPSVTPALAAVAPSAPGDVRAHDATGKPLTIDQWRALTDVRGNISNKITGIVGNRVTMTLPNFSVMPDFVGIKTIYSERQVCKMIKIEKLTILESAYSCTLAGDESALKRALLEHSAFHPTITISD